MASSEATAFGPVGSVSCTGILRRFEDGTWGALCFELGLITRGGTPESTLAQMAELAQYELELVAEGERARPASVELLSDFITCEPQDEDTGPNWVGSACEIRAFRIAEPPSQLAVA